MLTISQAVEKVIKVKPFVTEALCEGLINISSLSRQIHPTIEKLTGKEVKQGAIVMALNRLVPSLKGNGDLTYRNVITSIGDIIVRSDLTDYTFRNSPTIIENHVKLMNQLVGRQDQFCTVVRGVFETRWLSAPRFVRSSRSSSPVRTAPTRTPASRQSP